MPESGTIISPNQAIDVARRALTEMVPDAEKVRLEEITLSEVVQRWLVTLSFFSKAQPEEYDDTLMEALKLDFKKQRQLRTFEIDATSGYFRGMKRYRGA
jgi:hypothetical protein